ncbi:MAG: DUF3048 domain-containing protein [Candidatus Promineifilaceae bacterium]|jgi:outer membrane murein-binding lipoprotein Lpp
MDKQKTILIATILVLILLVSGCASESQPASTAGESVSEPTSAVEEPSADVDQTAEALAEAPEPTSEPTMTPTAKPEMTATRLETATPTAEATMPPTPEPTALPDGWYGPDNYPTGMDPLTGEILEDPTMLDHRPIAIKVSNYPTLVRPQAGLNNADLVFEHYAEGGSTRFTAVFYGKDAHTVGSVRSARLIDFEIPVMYDAAFGFSGAAGANEERFKTVDWFDRIVSPAFGSKGMYRAQLDDPDVDFWHTMFTDTYRLREVLQERGLDVAPQFQNGMVFSETPPEGGTEAGQVEIGYSGSYVTWWYNPRTGRYYRWNDGERHDDANTGEQLNTKNVVVIAAQHVDTWIPETEVGRGAKSIEIQIWGEGPASIFRDGQRFEGRWHRDDPHDMLTFTDEDGNPIPLGQGNTWFEVVPLGFDKLYVTS